MFKSIGPNAVWPPRESRGIWRRVAVGVAIVGLLGVTGLAGAGMQALTPAPQVVSVAP